MRQHLIALLLLWAIQVLAPGMELHSGTEEDLGSFDIESVENVLVLSLNECVRSAMVSNPDILVQSFTPRRREAQLAVQESIFDPSITGSAVNSSREAAQLNEFGLPRLFETNAQEYRIGFEDPLTTGGHYRLELWGVDSNLDVATLLPGQPPQSISTTEVDTNVLFTFTQPLLRNMGQQASRWRIVVARNDLDSSESSFRQTLIDTVTATEKAYWDLKFARMEFRTTKDSLRQAREFLEQNRVKVSAGTLAQAEIVQAEAQVAQREQELIGAELTVLDSEDALRRVMGVPIGSPIWSRTIRPSDDPPIAEVTPSFKEVEAAAHANRPDLEQARLRIHSGETTVAFRENQRRWGLDFEGSLGYLGVSFDDFSTNASGNIVGIAGGSNYQDSFEVLRDGDLPSWRMALVLNVPLGNRSAIEHYIDAKSTLQQSRLELERLEQTVLVETRTAVRRVIVGYKKLQAARVDLRLQRTKLEAEQMKFENHLTTSFEVLTFQTDLTRSHSRLNRAIIDYNKSLVDLESVKGTILSARGILLGGTEGGARADVTAPRSTSLRALWNRPLFASETRRLMLVDTEDYEIKLPLGIVLKGRRVAPYGVKIREFFRGADDIFGPE